jgi:hypothetical protein
MSYNYDLIVSEIMKVAINVEIFGYVEKRLDTNMLEPCAMMLSLC